MTFGFVVARFVTWRAAGAREHSNGRQPTRRRCSAARWERLERVTGGFLPSIFGEKTVFVALTDRARV